MERAVLIRVQNPALSRQEDRGAPSASSTGRPRRSPGSGWRPANSGNFFCSAHLCNLMRPSYTPWPGPAWPPRRPEPGHARPPGRAVPTHLRHVCGGQTPIPETSDSQAAERDSRGSRKGQREHLLGSAHGAALQREHVARGRVRAWGRDLRVVRTRAGQSGTGAGAGLPATGRRHASAPWGRGLGPMGRGFL